MRDLKNFLIGIFTIALVIAVVFGVIFLCIHFSKIFEIICEIFAWIVVGGMVIIFLLLMYGLLSDFGEYIEKQIKKLFRKKQKAT